MFIFELSVIAGFIKIILEQIYISFLYILKEMDDMYHMG